MDTGQALPSERELADQLGVSRNGLREALRVLETKGIIVTHHGVGRSVRDIRRTPLADWSLTGSIEVVTIDEVPEVRELLEPSAAALACARGTEDELRVMLTASEGADSWHDTERFHHAVAVAAHNYVLEQLVLQQTHLLEKLRQRDHYSSHQDVDTLVAEHRLIAEAIWRRDAAEAQALMRKHLQQTQLSIEHDAHDAEQA